MKEVRLDHRSILEIAREVAKILRRDELPDMVTTQEAADILGITPARMRQIKSRFPHVKKGADKQAKLLFRKADLLKEATS